MWVHTHVHESVLSMYGSVCVDVRGHLWVHSLVILYLIWRQYLSLNLEVSFVYTWPMSSRDPPVSILPWCWDNRHIPPWWAFHLDTRLLNSGGHVCAVGTLLTEPYPQPLSTGFTICIWTRRTYTRNENASESREAQSSLLILVGSMAEHLSCN